MPALSAPERRGALIVVALLAIGASYDLWRATRQPVPARYPGPATRTSDPAVPVAALAGASPDTTASANPGATRVDLNRADVVELDRLPGIGPVLARRIVEHRSRHGPFRRIEELRAVRGVGPRLLERLRPHVRLGSS